MLTSQQAISGLAPFGPISTVSLRFVHKSVHKSSDDVGSGLSDISAFYGSNTSSGLPPCAGASAK
jgi:hypothetical protein